MSDSSFTLANVKPKCNLWLLQIYLLSPFLFLCFIRNMQMIIKGNELKIELAIIYLFSKKVLVEWNECTLI